MNSISRQKLGMGRGETPFLERLTGIFREEEEGGDCVYLAVVGTVGAKTVLWRADGESRSAFGTVGGRRMFQSEREWGSFSCDV